jgi:hypothetical protein
MVTAFTRPTMLVALLKVFKEGFQKGPQVNQFMPVANK